MGTLVFVAAEAREFDGFSRHVLAVRELRWPLRFCRGAIMNGREVVLLANGPGPALAVAAAKEAKNRLEKVDAFVSTGYCGALDSNLGRTAIVVASEVNGNRSDKPDAPAVFTAGPITSQDRVACTIEEKSNLRESGAIAVEMEAAGVCRVALDAGVPFYCVRVVTDTASDVLPLDFNRMRGADGRFSTAKILGAAALRPLRVAPALVRLQRTTKSASIALGDFIANCRF